MKITDIKESWLKKQSFKLEAGLSIEGIHHRKLKSFVDGRGDVIELWSQPWIKDGNIATAKHVYQSATDYGVVKCWHLHAKHTDQFTVTRGKLQVSMVDVRTNSSTFLHVNKVFMGIQQPTLLKIPPGIMHGWKALTGPEVIVVNFQSEIYDPADEIKFSWDCILKDFWEPRNG